MDKKDSITDLQQARAIVHSVGEPHQSQVIDMLRGLTYNPSEDETKEKAQTVIGYMTDEYALNVANALWSEKYDEIPDFIKNR
ncbi:hypothetical protein [Alkalicoccobacillus porphyridii]|uniref:Uncharacterized protein n=1 Tax=Alkalicoccobacillus porphyridii TaxID=2597270 RepID=A0A554A0C3_9BACI|nr:hypothetical protein [Alkalicoccobacillus porphyridii]TSB47140.1 hypothetical protein FN960_09020 [Alkalicoccobacillus porphyridii]